MIIIIILGLLLLWILLFLLLTYHPYYYCDRQYYYIMLIIYSLEVMYYIFIFTDDNLNSGGLQLIHYSYLIAVDLHSTLSRLWSTIRIRYMIVDLTYYCTIQIFVLIFLTPNVQTLILREPCCVSIIQLINVAYFSFKSVVIYGSVI